MVYNSNIEGIVVFLAIIILIMARRIKSGLNGRRFKMSRIFTMPFIYAILLIFFLGAIGKNVTYIFIVAGLIFPGIIVGFIYGERVKFFEKNSFTYYKRSQFIMVFWLTSYIARIFLYIFYPTNFMANFIVDILLAITLGMIVGESVKLYIKYKEYRSPANENYFEFPGK